MLALRVLKNSTRKVVAHSQPRLVTTRQKSSMGSTSFWADLRQKAASAITSSLSEEERGELLAKYTPEQTKPATVNGATQTNNNNDDTSTNKVDVEVMRTSIAEAVAEARAKEAQLQQQKWEKEMDAYKAEMEQAARDRVESDLALQRRKIQFEQWKQQVEQDREQQQQQAQTQSSVASTTQEVDEVLGPVLADLGSKKLYLVSAATLSNLPVWKKQRTYRHDRAKVMAKDKSKTLHLGMPGIINLFQDKQGTLTILDGQHRVGMMQLLAEKKAAISLDEVLVEVHTCPDSEEDEEKFARELFVEINKAEPVKLVDMPGVAKESDRRILTKAAEDLRESYPDMFSPSQNCRSPHVNIDNLRDALFASNVLKKHSISSDKALTKWILERNRELGENYQGKTEVDGIPSRALTKAQKFDFYLGLDATWMYK